MSTPLSESPYDGEQKRETGNGPGWFVSFASPCILIAAIAYMVFLPISQTSLSESKL
ncbi:hypothetical protein PDIG_86430 [Penicillium digitatum PHI26]|uniref:Uncharacterized protein n=2 Tax=Penicillium digitatum TaxID=36651 RepID=K9F9X2_PEND2|nr:hypothetical protein PDIP_32450 [Penicillium digitatum Pd1]EKV04842.1 hypothetical protein PDIG_86430 [Penicillium digitatum PHI26]EKV17229.1 hypothetical protein PDIP_32450 [Penicillium digitatum Pd1]